MDYMRQAACSGNRASMIFLAKAYDTGINVRLALSLFFKYLNLFILYSYFIVWVIFFVIEYGKNVSEFFNFLYN